MAADLGAVTHTSVTWTAGDVVTEAKLDNMVANDQAYDSHAAQGLLLNNNIAFCGKDAGGTARNLLKLNASDVAEISAWDWWAQLPTAGVPTYASATTMNAPAGIDFTKYLQKGDRITLIQGGVTKYFYVVTVAATLLTVTGGSDYSVANSAISGFKYSKGNPPGFPQVFTYNCSPDSIAPITWTSTTQGISKFRMDGTMVTCYWSVWGITGGTAGPSLTLTLPIPSFMSGGGNLGTGCMFLEGGTALKGGFIYNSSASGVIIRKYDSSVITLGNDRQVVGTFVYEAA